VDFLLVLIEVFSLNVTAEALRTKRDRESAISLLRGQLDPGRRGCPLQSSSPIIILHG